MTELTLFRDHENVSCPFCNYSAHEDDILMFEDYVEYPMIWCVYCGARAVLDPKTFNEFDRYGSLQ